MKTIWPGRRAAESTHMWRHGAGTVLLSLILAMVPASGRALAFGTHVQSRHGMALSMTSAHHLTSWRVLPAGLAPAPRRAVAHDAAVLHGIAPAATVVLPGTTWSQQAELTVPNIGGLGHAVAISGSTAIATAPDIGAFVFVRHGTTWSQQAKLTPTGGTSGYFGGAVALSGDTAVVGADSTHGGGAAYVFVRSGTTWSQQQEITPTNGEPFEGFGTSVAVSGNTLVIGSDPPNTSGAAYVYVRSGTSWVEEARLIANHPAASDYFGAHVALSGNTALISGLTGTNGVGAAYIFVRSGTTWTQQAELIDPNGQASDAYSSGVALSGNTAAIAAMNLAAVYVYVRSGTMWTQQTELVGAGGAGYFGVSVALSGNTLISGGNTSNNFTGNAYIYVRSGTTWTQQAVLTGSCTGSHSNFGVAAGVSGNTAVVGADGVGGCGEKGAAYVFVRH